MAIIKCKMCGGELNLEDGMTVAECEYCGSQQTLPKLVSDNIANLYDRANHFRRNNDFDKAEGIYERILAETPEDSEAYWSLVLCRYGIEYVEDPTSGKRVPTVNRAQYTSIFDDENYKSAIQHADAIQRRVYEEEAAAINEIQKGILAISQKEEPFDVFICYKETDQNGRRTRDSVIANDLYHQLIKEGFKVFFSRITLEDKLGTAYEPYIFAALNSSKVMVVLGTKPEHFNAVWVKNEWSRYLALVKQSGGEKVLIPAYRDMDPYDLPEEFSHLQAQDMSKLGFMQDLIRGIKKITGADNKPKVQPQVQTVAVNTVSAGAADISPLLKRMFMHLEDGEWEKADEYAERVLDKDPENAEAYLGKLMAELHVRRRQDLQNQAHPFDEKSNYTKALRFGDEKIKNELNEYITHIKTRNKNSIYDKAINLMNAAKTEGAYKDAAKKFTAIPRWKDADKLAKECLEKAEIARKDAIYDNAFSVMNQANTEAEYKNASKIFKTIPCWKDADKLAKECLEKAEIARKDAIYSDASSIMNSANSELTLNDAADMFNSISGWKDSDSQAEICLKKIEEIKVKKEADKLERERKKKKRKKKIKIFSAIGIPAVCILIAFVIILNTIIIPNVKISKAKELAGQNKFSEAIDELDLVNNQEADDLRTVITISEAKYLAEKSDFIEAIDKLDKVDTQEAKSLKREYTISAAKAFAEEKKYSAASFYLMKAGIDDETRELYYEYSGKTLIAAGPQNSYGIMENGNVVATGDDYYKLNNVSGWRDIIAVSAEYGHAVGLKSNGTVNGIGDDIYSGSPCGSLNVNDWSDIVSVAVGTAHSVGLKSDGTVVATGDNRYGQCDVEDWTDIISIAAAEYDTIGLKANGHVVITGISSKYDNDDLAKWSDIVSISAFSNEDKVIGLKSDGTVVFEGYAEHGEGNVSEWKDIIAVSMGASHTVGLKADGTVVAVGGEGTAWYGQCNVDSWKDIIAISAGGFHTLGLKSDGTVVSTGHNDDGECDVSDWKLW